ncbi:hypothetical protein OUZ56_020020 [Daphnia magna]|uniref:Uncharacterized protein n=1 Tax=Daphnia magna TaxID=35525 RepID=A0ABQ9ZDC1_9CRUS|nr:hypothetical protein OUZ56_020020 [Daphnia magna]
MTTRWFFNSFFVRRGRNGFESKRYQTQREEGGSQKTRRFLYRPFVPRINADHVHLAQQSSIDFQSFAIQLFAIRYYTLHVTSTP